MSFILLVKLWIDVVLKSRFKIMLKVKKSQRQTLISSKKKIKILNLLLKTITISYSFFSESKSVTKSRVDYKSKGQIGGI